MAPSIVTPDELLQRYDAFLLDAYGVLMNEAGPLEGAAEFVERMNADGIPYCVLTNDAAKLPQTTAARLNRMQIAVSEDNIVTSGSLLAPYFREQELMSKRTFVLGPADSIRYAEFAGARVVDIDQNFEVLVIGDESGYPFLETVDATLTALYRRIDSGKPLHLIVPNPDIVYPAGAGAYGFAAGGIAAMFESALALRYPERTDLRFARLGKPNRMIFDEGLRRLGGNFRVAMIGDTIETDIRGANNAGIDSILIATGVSLPDWSKLPAGSLPKAWLPSFTNNK